MGRSFVMSGNLQRGRDGHSEDTQTKREAAFGSIVELELQVRWALVRRQIPRQTTPTYILPLTDDMLFHFERLPTSFP